MSYDDSFYDTIRDGCRRSARAVVPRIIELLRPHRVLDIGCGEGIWLSVFAEHGCQIMGADANPTRLAISEDCFVRADLAVALPGELVEWRPLLTICLEVAEHLPAQRADSFVAELCQTADWVLFSAAIPGQGGTGHINEQWPDYWVTRFQANGFRCSGALRWEFWDNDEVENWYRQNLMLCCREGAELPPSLSYIMFGERSPMWPVVHPVLFNHVRSSR